MAIEIVINLNMRFTILDLQLFDRLSSLDDIPAIVIKLKPISWAKNSPTLCYHSKINEAKISQIPTKMIGNHSQNAYPSCEI